MIEDNKMTILYVDDEAINLFLFTTTFKNKYNVITATSGSEALQKLETNANDINVVISDMRMPEMNGIEFIEEAKKGFKEKSFFILTAYSYEENVEKALKDELIKSIFTKPFNVAEIVKAVDNC
jgi:response regulator RpfG family c-di-GMP phosphodiesterase